MDERCDGGIGLRNRGVDAVLAECPVDLPEQVALARCMALIVARERLAAAALVAISDGVSSPARSVDHRHRVAQDAVWGGFCAVAGCTNPKTVPHHVRPYWKSRETTLKDLVPLCEGDHHNVHEGHRTMRLNDGRRIDEHGWVVDRQ